MRFAPALREQALIEAIRVFRLAGPVGHRLQRLGRVLGTEVIRILVLQREAQPNIKKSDSSE